MRTVRNSVMWSDNQTLTSSNGAEPKEMSDPAKAPLKPTVSALGFPTDIQDLTPVPPAVRYRREYPD